MTNLLNSRGLLKTIGINTTKEIFLQVHRVEGCGALIPVGLDVTFLNLATSGLVLISHDDIITFSKIGFSGCIGVASNPKYMSNHPTTPTTLMLSMAASFTTTSPFQNPTWVILNSWILITTIA